MNDQHPSLELAAPVNPAWRIGIVHASYYPEEVRHLAQGAEDMLVRAGISQNHIKRYPVFGSFEIPLVGAQLALEKEVDALIGIGVIVEGETHHAELVARSAVSGIMDVQVRFHIPFAFEILYVDDIEKVRKRLDRGAEAARAVLHSLALLQRIRS
jgi:6,7-dimethyl-8-ribityllumazine synthase